MDAKIIGSGSVEKSYVLRFLERPMTYPIWLEKVYS